MAKKKDSKKAIAVREDVVIGKVSGRTYYKNGDAYTIHPERLEEYSDIISESDAIRMLVKMVTDDCTERLNVLEKGRSKWWTDFFQDVGVFGKHAVLDQSAGTVTIKPDEQE